MFPRYLDTRTLGRCPLPSHPFAPSVFSLGRQGLFAHDNTHHTLANKKPCPFAVLGLGKFGARELGYASDIEVLFIYGGSGSTNGKDSIENSEYFERLAQELLGWIEAKQEGIYRLDVRLRPYGGKGALANAFEEVCRYYSPTGLAAPFERQALIKLRHIAGDSTLGHRLEAHRDSFVTRTS